MSPEAVAPQETASPGPAVGNKMAAPPKPKARLPRYEQLDAFRLTVIAVITFHTWQRSDLGGGLVLPPGTLVGSIVSNLDFLLAFYFMMTGFGVAAQLFRPVIAGDELPETGPFLAKRFARLLPVYFVVFLAVWELRYAGTERQWADFFWGATLMQSWSTEHIFATIDPAWYLSVEVGFLLFLAAVGLPAMRRIARWKTERARIRGLIGFALFCIALSWAWKGYALATDVAFDEWGVWFAPPAWIDLWALGLLFGLAVQRLDRADRWVARGVPLALTIASLAWLWGLGILSDQGLVLRAWRWDAAAVGILGLMVAAVMARPETIARRIMGSRPVQLLAGCSYGMYLVHAPVLRWLSGEGYLPLHDTTQWALSTAALLALSAILGWLTLKYIELPGQGLATIHLPERSRRWHEAKPIKRRLAVGDEYPDALRDLVGQADGPMVILITPAARTRPLHQGDASSIALYALLADRFLVESIGGRLGFIVADNDPGRIDRIMKSEGIMITAIGAPGGVLAYDAGIGGHRLRNGEVAPSRCMVIVSPAGIVTAILEDTNGEELARRAINEAQRAGLRAVESKAA